MIGVGHETFAEMGDEPAPRSLVELAEMHYTGPGDPFHLDDGEGICAVGRSAVSIGLPGSGASLVLRNGGEAM